jgi:serine/threonine-protein kinase
MTNDDGIDIDQLPLPALERVDRKCLEFEASWNSGSVLPLEGFLVDTCGAERAKTLRELLLLDVDYRLRNSERPVAAEYIGRFPDDADTIADVFQRLATEVPSETLPDTSPTGVPRNEPPPAMESTRFRMLRPHAKGGLGEVFLAHDTQLNRQVALKEMQARHADHAERRARFVKEAEITSSLEHPGIVPVHSLGVHADGRPFYTMRFVDGERLTDAIHRYHAPGKEMSAAERSMEFRKLLRCWIDVCQTIEFAHSRGVLHRDIKPENILIGKFGETLVVDWGLAKAVAQTEGAASPPGDQCPLDHRAEDAAGETRVGAAIGTPAYMSPEQAAGNIAQIDERSDVYALGATLYAILTGGPPFANEDTSLVIRAVQEGRFARPRKKQPGTPRALEAICLTAMALDPAHRYRSARALSEDMEAWLAGEAIVARREPLTESLGRFVRKHQTALFASAVILIILAVSLGIGTALLGSKNRELRELNRRETLALEDARQRFELAMEAIESYYTGVSEDVVLRAPELRDLRDKLLRNALAFYERLRVELDAAGDRDSRRSLAQALESIGKITQRIGEDEHAQNALREAINLRQQLANEDPDDAQLWSALAGSHNRLGSIYNSSGQHDKARVAYKDAAGLMHKAVGLQPHDDALQSQLAECFNNLGAVTDPAEACDYFRQAIAIQTDLTQRYPGDEWYQNKLAKHHGNLAAVLDDLDRHDEALVHCQRAVELDRDLVADHPNNVDHLEDFSSHCFRLSNMYRSVGRNAQALVTLREAVSVDERLAANFTSVRDYQWALLKRYNNLGLLEWECGSRDEAQTAFDRAIAIGEPLMARWPTVADFAIVTGASHCNRGNLIWSEGDAELSLKSYDKAISLLTTVLGRDDLRRNGRQFLHNSLCARARVRCALGEYDGAAVDWSAAIDLQVTDGVALHLHRARAVALAGDRQAAIVEAREVAVGASTPDAKVDAARVFSLAAEAVQHDKSLAPEARDKCVDELLCEALQLLTQAKQLGYFDEPGRGGLLRTDPDFQPLRSRDDFASLLEIGESH